ncbi:MAG: hypothetical protein HFF11_04675 [Angelakisella sp.]|jgi:hypothetical protein|nr:hypothetical protein [Angelakisella sp.]
MRSSGAKLTLVSLLVILTAVGLAWVLAWATPEGEGGGDMGENWAPAVQEGRLPGFEDATVNNDGRYFFYQICKDVEFSRPSAPGNVLLENTTGNAFDMQVEYVSEDYGVIYRSPVLAPNTHLLKDKLNQELPEGTYQVKANVYVLDPETGEQEETFTESIQLQVKKPFFG